MTGELNAAEKFALIYVAAVSVIGIVLTVYDKAASKRSRNGRGRVPENTLMYLGFLGGALPMYVTMLIIRHKTKHKKFMIGLPVFAAVHIAVAVTVFLRMNT